MAGLPPHLQLHCTPEEMYFFAKDELISIVPNFSLATENATCQCIAGEFGPFQPNTECQVPLWLAISLWKRRKCSIIAPEWMEPSHLKDVLDAERSDAATFQPLPFHHVEIAQCLFTSGIDDALSQEVFRDNLTIVKELIGSIQKARMTKILEGLNQLNGPVTVKLNNLGSMEINAVRAFFGGALDLFYKVGMMDRDTMPGDLGVGNGGNGGEVGMEKGGGGGGVQPARQLRRGTGQ